jgi:CheY-like chemotaxis protein
LKFSVQDNGIGLTEKQKKSIFEAYGQASACTSRKYGGTGLGLTISRDMVRLMGGELEVKSKENEGATFFFTLSLERDKQQRPEAAPDFSGLSIGLALPVQSITRQSDLNLEHYVRHLGADFSFYYYDELFEADTPAALPDLMIFDHHYARLSGELELCASLDCNSVLLTNGTLRSRVDPAQHHFEDVVLTPVSLAKTIRILSSAKEKKHEKVLPDRTRASQKLRALVADDNTINCKLIKIILENLALDVTVVSNGKEAVEMVKENAYDIIFMDIQMPVMDGLEANKNILAYESKHGLKHIPVVALTANTSVSDRERYLAEGMDDYAVKPLEVEALEAIISKHCRG